MKSAIYWGSVCAATVLFAASVSAEMITPDAVYASSWFNSPETVPGNLINGSQFNDTGNPLTSTINVGNFGLWHAGDVPGSILPAPGNPPVVADQWVAFEFDTPQLLSKAYIWQSAQHGVAALLGRGVKDLNILYSTDGAVSFSNALTTSSTTLNIGSSHTTGNVEPVQVVEFSGPIAGITHIAFDIISAHSGATNEYVGLSEVRFEAVPEPTSLALLGLGGLMMIKRRRRDLVNPPTSGAAPRKGRVAIASGCRLF